MTDTKRPQKGRIFISYRRIDTSYAAGRIYDRLVAKFGEDAIFMDVDTLEGGVDFVKVLEDAVQSCDVLIALIGRQWLNIKDKDGTRRLDSPEDFVRIEIVTALKRNIRVIPVLVDGVEIPQPAELPENLRTLARRNALQVNHHSFNSDVYRLVEHTESALVEAEEKKPQKAAKEKANHEFEKQAENQPEFERAIKKIDRDHNARLRKIEWQYRWETFLGEISYFLKLLRINFVPVLIVLIGLVVIIPLSLDIYKNIPELAQPLNVTLTSQVITPLQTSEPAITLFPTKSVTPSPEEPIIPTPSVEMLVSACIYAIQEQDQSLLTIGGKFGVDYRLIEYYYGEPKFSVGELVKIPNVKQDTCIDKDGLPEEMNDSMGVEMVLVLAGNFVMGNEDDSQYKIPERPVSLETFYIDRYEVTNALYKACVDTGNCTAPTNNESETRADYYGNPEFDNYPVIYVNWGMATDYCEWRDSRLPTNEQWEKAARDADERTFPWGDDIDESHANYNSKDTVAVGSYEIGRSPIGAYDMAGNVSEWVVGSSDSPYLFNPDDNIRGGSWFDGQEVFLRSYFPGFATTQYETNNRFGFRCAINDPQPFSQLSE